MNSKPLNQAHDEDARNVTAALQRAGQRARTVAAQTQTDIIIVRNGKLIRETPTGIPVTRPLLNQAG